MNIFYIDKTPQQAAEWMVDSHVVKMILESAQLLCTAHRMLDGNQIPGKSRTGRNVKRFVLSDDRDAVLYQATHVNHPSAVWARTSTNNYLWLMEHFYALNREYSYRYGNKVHKCFGLASLLQSPPKNLKKHELTEMPCAMDKQYIISADPVINYRNYYKYGKARLHRWTNRQPPDWII